MVFRNDFQHGKEDRNLYLDRYEIARVGDSRRPSARTRQTVKGPPVAQTAHPPQPQPPATSILNSPTPAPTNRGPRPPAAVDAPRASDASYIPAEGAQNVTVRMPWWRACRVPSARRGPPGWTSSSTVSRRASDCSDRRRRPTRWSFPLLARQTRPRQSSDHRARARRRRPRHRFAPAQTVQRARPSSRSCPDRTNAPCFCSTGWPSDRSPRELAAVLTLGEKARGSTTGSPLATRRPPNRPSCARACRKFPRIDDEYQASTRRAIAQWISSDNPVRSRFTAWTENHFSTWVTKTRGAPKWHEHLDFCWMGVAPFADLLSVSAHSPAMLAYLDQEKELRRQAQRKTTPARSWNCTPSACTAVTSRPT